MPRPLIDLSAVDLEATHLDTQGIEKINPHRYEFRLLDRVIHMDLNDNIAVGIFHVREGQFWIRGHIPGRPLFPGVLQIEASAQLCSIMASYILPKVSETEKKDFFGFVGVDNIKFRQQVIPGDDLILVVKLIESRRVVRFDTQGIVNNKIVFSGQIIGTNI